MTEFETMLKKMSIEEVVSMCDGQYACAKELSEEERLAIKAKRIGVSVDSLRAYLADSEAVRKQRFEKVLEEMLEYIAASLDCGRKKKRSSIGVIPYAISLFALYTICYFFHF